MFLVLGEHQRRLVAHERQQRPVLRCRVPAVPALRVAREQLRVAGDVVDLPVAHDEPGGHVAVQQDRRDGTVLSAQFPVQLCRILGELRPVQLDPLLGMVGQHPGEGGPGGIGHQTASRAVCRANRCSTRAISTSLQDWRSRASQSTSGTWSPSDNAARTSASPCCDCPKQLTRHDERGAAGLQPVDRVEGVVEPAGVDEHDRAQAAHEQPVPQEPEPFLAWRAEQVEHLLVGEADPAEVEGDRGTGLAWCVARVVDALAGLGHGLLGAQRPDLADRADEGGLAHAEAADDDDLEALTRGAGQLGSVEGVRVGGVHEARPAGCRGRATGRSWSAWQRDDGPTPCRSPRGRRRGSW